MRDIPLHEFIKGRTQESVAAMIGVNQSAVSQMLHSARDIRVRKVGKTWAAYEVKQIGNPATVKAEALG